MPELNQAYEAFERLNDASIRFIEYGKDLTDELYQEIALKQAVNQCESIEELNLVLSVFSVEADATTGGTTKTGSTTGSTAKTKIAGISSAVMNKTRGAMSKVKAFMVNASNWFKEFYTKSEFYAKKVKASLTATLEELEKSNNNVNAKINKVCLSPQDVQITAILSQISGAKSKDDCGRIIDTMKSTYQGKVPKEDQQMSKDQVLGLGRQYLEAIDRAINDRKASSSFFTSTAEKAANGKTEEELALTSVHTNAAMSAAQFTVQFILQNATALDNAIKKSMAKNG